METVISLQSAFVETIVGREHVARAERGRSLGRPA
jgi:hypothetical protein